MRNSPKLEIDKTKIMVWVKEDSISGNTFIGIEFPKTIPVQRRIDIAFQLGRIESVLRINKVIRFTRIFKGELVKLIEPDLKTIIDDFTYWGIKYFNIKF